MPSPSPAMADMETPTPVRRKPCAKPLEMAMPTEVSDREAPAPDDLAEASGDAAAGDDSEP